MLKDAVHQFVYLSVMGQVSNFTIRQVSFYVVLIALGILLFKELYAYVPAALGAITFYLLMRNSHRTLIEKRNWSPQLSTILLMLASFLVIVLPIGLLITLLSSKVEYAIMKSNEALNALNKVVNDIEERYKVELVTDENLKNLANNIAQWLPNVLNATFHSLLAIVILYFILYYLLMEGKELEKWLLNHIPLQHQNIQRIGEEFNTLVVSNALGIPLTAIIQGIVALIGYWILGVSDPWFWFVVTTFAAMLPLVGSALGYVPLAAILFATGKTTHAWILLVYGVVVVGSVDNLARMFLQKKMGNIHPLITVLGVIAGIQLFGFVGLIFGPILIAIFILLIRIYFNEFVPEKRKVDFQDNSSS